MAQETIGPRRGIVVEYGPDEVGYVSDSDSDLCVGFSKAVLARLQPNLPKIKNGSRVVYHLDESGRIDQMSLDLSHLAQELEK